MKVRFLGPAEIEMLEAMTYYEKGIRDLTDGDLQE